MRLLLDLKVKKSSILLAVYLFSMFLPGYFSSQVMQMVSNFSKIQAVAFYDTNNMLFCIFNRNNIHIS